MPLRVESRRAGEWVLRAALLALLGLALWRSTQPVTSAHGARTVAVTTLSRELGAVVANARVSALDVAVDSTLAPAERDALVALRRSGIPVRWSGSAHPLPVQDAPRRRADG